LKRRLAESSGHEPAPAPNSPAERELIERLTQAYESDDLDGLVALLSEDVWLRMPPVPLEYQGRELVRQFFSTVAFGKGRSVRLVPTRANAQPALALYVRDPNADIFHANGIMVLTLAGDQIFVMTGFDNSALPWFRLPRSLPG
jgi:RNA polymerase sigma-70 factor (ECF subfamily)